MKRNLHEQEWAKKLKEWEASTSSQPWQRPAAGGWDRIAENLPSNEKKPLFAWWKMTILMLVLTGIGGGFYSYSFQENNLNTGFNKDNYSTQGNSIKEVDDSSQDVFVFSKTNTENQKTEQLSGAASVPSNSVNNLLNKQKTITESVEIQNSKIEKQPTSTGIDIEQNNRLEINQQKTSPPQVQTEKENKPLGIDTAATNQIASEADQLKTAATNNLPSQAIEPPPSIVSNKESEWIPTLVLGVQAKDIGLGVQPSLSKEKKSLWVVDVYAQYSFQPSFYNFSPLWNLQRVARGVHHKNKRNQSYGLQVNRILEKGFSVHVGIQQQRHFYTNKGLFRRKFNTVDEDNMRRTTYQFSTAVSEDKNIEEDVKVVRGSEEPVPTGTTLRFRVERAISVETSSIPIGISCIFFQAYPFQFSGVFGGEYSRIKTQSKLTHLSILHHGFRVEQVHTQNRGNETIVSSDFSLQAGLRLDVYLTPSIKALLQLDWQNVKPQKTRGPLLGTGNQMRFGLSYDL